MARTGFDVGELGRRGQEILADRWSRDLAVVVQEIRFPGPKLVEVFREINSSGERCGTGVTPCPPDRSS